MIDAEHPIASMIVELDDTLCPSCVTALTATLMKYQGVIKATVKPQQNSFILDFNPEKISRISLEEIVHSAVAGNTAHHENHSDNIAIDPVCGMTVKIDTTELYSDFEGKRYFFCARSCKIAFEEDSMSYIDDQNENNDE